MINSKAQIIKQRNKNKINKLKRRKRFSREEISYKFFFFDFPIRLDTSKKKKQTNKQSFEIRTKRRDVMNILVYKYLDT